MGYTNVLDYEGGKQDWIEGGNPVVGQHAHQHEHKPAIKDATTNPEEDVA
ncbi:MAG: hypothetical protein JWO13_547 [Acidobacteriales bacterium]|nr:hypothetical protein [Terriglobales bacterium]